MCQRGNFVYTESSNELELGHICDTTGTSTGNLEYIYIHGAHNPTKPTLHNEDIQANTHTHARVKSSRVPYKQNI